MLDQFITALHRPEILAEKADWLVIAARIVELRSLLLLPRDSPEQRQAETDAEGRRTRLTELPAVQALAAWLDEAGPLYRPRPPDWSWSWS